MEETSMRWLFACILSLCLLLGAFLFLADCDTAYHFLYRRRGVYEELPWSREQIGELTEHIRDYLFERSDNLFVVLDGELVFKAQEIFHMWEVRVIFRTMRRIFLGLLLVLGIGVFRLPARDLFRRQLFTTAGFFIALVPATLFFQESFLWMHLLMFDNPYWSFSYDHRLIQLLQQEFFLGFLIMTIVLTLASSVIFYLFARKGGSRASHL